MDGPDRPPIQLAELLSALCHVPGQDYALAKPGNRTPLGCPQRVVCHERNRSKRLRATVREMKEGPSGSAIRSPIPSHRKLLRSKAVVVSVAETSGL